MSDTTTRATTRLYVRADPHEKARIEYAARLVKQNVSDFVRSAVEDRAEAVLAEQQRTTLSPADFDAIEKALDAPLTPSKTLRAAVQKSRVFVQK